VQPDNVFQGLDAATQNGRAVVGEQLPNMSARAEWDVDALPEEMAGVQVGPDLLTDRLTQPEECARVVDDEARMHLEAQSAHPVRSCEGGLLLPAGQRADERYDLADRNTRIFRITAVEAAPHPAHQRGHLLAGPELATGTFIHHASGLDAEHARPRHALGKSLTRVQLLFSAAPVLVESLSVETSVVVAIIWTAWHLPYFGWVDHLLATTPLPAFTLFGLASSVVLTWLYIRTGNSALSAIVLQSANLTCQVLLHVAPSQRPLDVLAGLYALVALLLVFSRQLGTGVLEPDSGRAAE
jgi:hypothetical protein